MARSSAYSSWSLSSNARSNAVSRGRIRNRRTTIQGSNTVFKTLPEALVFATCTGTPFDRHNLGNKQLKPTCRQ